MADKVLIEGIQQSGGHIDVDVLAVGRGARAEKVVHDARTELERTGLQEVADKLDELVAIMQANHDELANAEEITAATERVATELGGNQPNKLVIGSLLRGIAEGSGAVTAVAKAATALAALVATSL